LIFQMSSMLSTTIFLLILMTTFTESVELVELVMLVLLLLSSTEEIEVLSVSLWISSRRLTRRFLLSLIQSLERVDLAEVAEVADVEVLLEPLVLVITVDRAVVAEVDTPMAVVNTMKAVVDVAAAAVAAATLTATTGTGMVTRILRIVGGKEKKTGRKTKTFFLFTFYKIMEKYGFYSSLSLIFDDCIRKRNFTEGLMGE